MDLSRFMATPGEKPLDNIVNDAGFFKIFRSVAIIGDSLSSGEFESNMEGGVIGHPLYNEKYKR